MSETVRVAISWDSGPYGTYCQTDRPAHSKNSYGETVVEVPADLWLRYLDARDALDEATDELDAVADSAVPRPGDPA